MKCGARVWRLSCRCRLGSSKERVVNHEIWDREIAIHILTDAAYRLCTRIDLQGRQDEGLCFQPSLEYPTFLAVPTAPDAGHSRFGLLQFSLVATTIPKQHEDDDRGLLHQAEKVRVCFGFVRLWP